MLNPKRIGKRLSLTVALAAAVSAAPKASRAVNVQQYTPAANTTYSFTEDAMLQVAPYDPTWNGSRLFFSADYNWVNDPLIQYNGDRTVRTATLVDGINTLDFGAGWYLAKRFTVGFSVPLNMVHIPGAAQQFAFGDSRAFFKWRLTADNAFLAVSIMPEMWLPTGNNQLFVSDNGLGYGARLMFEHDFGPVRAAFNIGYRYASAAQYFDLDYTHRVPMALGLFIPLDKRWGVNVEGKGAVVIPTNAYNNPNEGYVGARYQINPEFTALGGASIGAFNNSGGNDVRVSVGLRFSPMNKAAPAIKMTEIPKSIPQRLTPAILPPPPAPRVVFTVKEITLGEEIKFKHGSAVLTDSGRKLLDEVADVMKKNREGYHKILIEGHTNELGTYPYNQKLSEQRAQSVREYLTSRGISAKELMTIGYGKTKPKLLKGLSKDALLAANRRVKFKVIN